MISEGILILGNYYKELFRESIWFVYSHFLQTQLDEIQYQWKTHCIRRSRHGTIPGIPGIRYFNAGISGYSKYLKIAEFIIFDYCLNALLHQKKYPS